VGCDVTVCQRSTLRRFADAEVPAARFGAQNFKELVVRLGISHLRRIGRSCHDVCELRHGCVWGWSEGEMGLFRLPLFVAVCPDLPIPGRINSPALFWQARFYDFNVCTPEKRIEKLRYMHRNPVKRGLVTSPELWTWSSFRWYALREPGPVKIEDWSVLKLKMRESVGFGETPA